MKSAILFSIILTCGFQSESQVSVKTNNGTINVYKKYPRPAKKAQVLLFSKYINVKKELFIELDHNTMGAPLNIQRPIEPIVFGGNLMGSKFLRLKFDGKNIFLFADVIGFDDKLIARISGNELDPLSKAHQYITDSTLEMIDENDIPVLQIQLKPNNVIVVQGVFNLSSAYVIINEDPTLAKIVRFPKYKVDMTDDEKRKWFHQYLADTKEIPKLDTGPSQRYPPQYR